jgi:hypothetical protein
VRQVEHLVDVYKEMLAQMQRSQVSRDATLIVTMSPSSKTAGEIRGYVEKSGVKSSMPVNYRHYYMLNALREKMIEIAGDEWNQVKAVYEFDSLEFYCEY